MRYSQAMRTDVIVIGGGAAGLMAAGTAAQRGLGVTLLEPNDKLGRKLRITGKGRCNITNNCGVREFLQNVPTNPKFLYSSLTAFAPEKTMAFFEELGMPLKTERGSRVFPVSDSADDAADALGAWVRRQGAAIKKTAAKGLVLDNGAVTGVETVQGVMDCGAVIVCTGGLSYPLTGSTGDGLAFAAQAGHAVTPPRASLVPLECMETFCAELAGFAPRNVTLSVFEEGKLIYRELGEMLFTHFGVSGPLVLSASAHMRHWGERRYTLAIDFKPALDAQKLDARIQRDFAKYANRDFQNALSELEARSFIPVLVRQSGIPGQTKVHDVTREQRWALGALLKAFPLTVTAARPVAEAVVTAGGVDVRQVNPRTMESKLVRGLYFAGETLDVDAYTGGFNLQIAWATGRCAGMSVLSDSGEKREGETHD